ncbi:hypothetical protein pEaSNUABM46_00232 [Erwinia phage pEa_SNUABM_46]|nr:hypothetical protein pEaSNUABM45_00232 [Erwinia phage pEa_SNUABM_45]QYW04216.1 hypothetical protein pEaSNUABM46_00232 [Erwinia phage pEa_SNUABM_46]
MSIERDYERSARRLKESVRRMEQLGYVVPHCVVLVLSKLRPPKEVVSRKYLVILMLFSQTCETLGAALTMREQLVVKLTILGRKHPTPEITRKQQRIDQLVISQDKIIESNLDLLAYRSEILLAILSGEDPKSRYI